MIATLVLRWIKDNALTLICVLAFAGWSALAFYYGGRGPRAELAEFQARVAAATEALKREDAEREVRSTKMISELEARHAATLREIDRNWESAVADIRLRIPDPGSSATEEPIRVAAGVCADPAADQRLSDAIQRYVSGVAAADRRFAEGVATLLEHAQRQTDALIAAQQWAREEKLINRP